MTPLVRPLGPKDRTTLDTLLRAGGAADSWLRHALLSTGLKGFLGAFDDGLLVGVALLRGGALSASVLTTTEAARALVPAIRERSPWYSIVGPERPCAILARGLLGRLTARVDRVQVFMATDDVARLGPAADGVRPATADDLDALVPLVTRYRHEDGLSGPDEDPEGWVRAHVRERTERGLIHVLEEGGRIVFTGAFNFLGAEGAGLGGIYTVADARGRGVAARGTAALARLALGTSPVVTLHVDVRNAAARRCYEKVGFVAEGRYRLTFR